MKIFKSIKWRLQIWYGLILLAVLAGFGITAYQMERDREFRRIDDELQRRFAAVANALHPPGRPERRPPPFGGPPPEQIPSELPPPSNPRPIEFSLPPRDAALFGTIGRNNFYFLIFRNGREIARSTNAPNPQIFAYEESVLRPVRALPERSPKSGRPQQPKMVKTAFRDSRAIARRLPSGETIFIGCSVAPEIRELRISAAKLAGIGGIILLFGLVGGWWISSRAIKPVEDISATASRISAGNLSQRINVADTETELGQLASVLNSAFARLEAAFAQQQQFTADAAHELRTPVSVMLTQTQTSLNRDRSAAEYRETIEACQRATQRMRRLIESLLEMARLDAGQEQMKRMPFDLSPAINDCVELIRPLADERGVQIQCDLPSVACAGDSERVALVVTNLLTNAIQYNKESGEVRVKLKPHDGMAVLTVSDTGAGISAEDLPHVFERFYCADKSRSSAHTGLGLAISKAIVEAHGGTIEVSSQEDVGTTFTVRLPT